MDVDRAQKMVRLAERDSGWVNLGSVRDALSDDSATVRHHATHAFAEVAEDDPERVAEHLEALNPRLAAADVDVRRYAAAAFAAVAEVEPARVAEHLEALEPRLDDENESIRRYATAAFHRVAVADPARVAEYPETFEPRLADDDERADHAFENVDETDSEGVDKFLRVHESSLDAADEHVRELAAHTFDRVARNHPGSVGAYLDALEPCLADDNEDTRHYATSAFGRVAEADPERVAEHLGALEPRLDDDDAHTRKLALDAFEKVVEIYPGRVGKYLGTLVSRLTDDDKRTRRSATSIFSQVAVAAPERVAVYLEMLEPHIADEDRGTRHWAVYAFSRVAEADPERVVAYLDTLEPRLDDDSKYVRKDAVVAFAHVVDERPDAVVPHLASLVSLLDTDVRAYARSCIAAVARVRPDAVRELTRPPQRDRFSQTVLDRLAGVLRDAAPSVEGSARSREASSDDPSPTGDPSPAVAEHLESRGGSPPEEVPGGPEVSVELQAVTDERPVASGGNADVTEATVSTAEGETTLAIKKPRIAETVDRETMERLLAEAETWEKLDDHDHVVDLVDWGNSPTPWIAMEYMDGGHLGDRADDMGTAQKLWTALAVTEAVYHAHRRGVAHLDLKPANVLFRRVDDAWDVPKVADWGLSKRLLEHSKSVEGFSPRYAAPEQFDQAYGPTDDVTDVYQLGAVFYELFTGRPPFDGTPSKAMYRILHESPTPPNEVADVPNAVDDVLTTALAKQRRDRYDDVLYLRDNLRELFEKW
jgi:serine/threonine protein kinase